MELWDLHWLGCTLSAISEHSELQRPVMVDTKAKAKERDSQATHVLCGMIEPRRGYGSGRNLSP